MQPLPEIAPNRPLPVLALLLALAACSPAGPGPEDPLTGPWRGEITLRDRQVPFNFEVTRSGDSLAVHYVNGGERMPVESVRLAGSDLSLDFPSYSSTLRARVSGDTLSGTLTLVRADGGHELPVRAERGPRHRFFADPPAGFASLGGRWSMRLAIAADGSAEPAVAVIGQSGHQLTGTVMTSSGDYRYLAGEVRGNDLFLSSFDGGGVQLWTGTLAGDGTLAGTFDSVTARASRWTAVRDDAATLADRSSLARLRPGEERIRFSFPDLDGRTVSLDDARFRGKVVLVILAGSWCSTCHDEARTMSPIYAGYAPRGLEVVYLMFEYTDDLDAVRGQIEAYRDRYGIRHPMLFVGDTGSPTRQAALPMLSDVAAFPTTIFVDRRGVVRTIHTAFPGPATGAAHEDYKREFRRLVEELLAEPPPAA